MKIILHKARVYLFIAGLSSLFFGVIILVSHAVVLPELIRLFAAYMIIKGLALSIGAWKTGREESYWLFLLTYGLLNVFTGITAYVYPGVTLLVLGFIVSVNLFVSGILQWIMARQLHKEIKREGWLLFSGTVAVIAGTYIYVMPRVGNQTILYLIAISALILSVYLISLFLDARKWHANDNILPGPLSDTPLRSVRNNSRS